MLRVGKRGLPPTRTVQATHASKKQIIVNTVGIRPDKGTRRISVHSDYNRRAAQPVHIQAIDGVLLFVLAKSIDVETIVEEILAEQSRQAARSLTILVDHAVISVDLQSFKILAKIEVEDTRNSVSAINRRSAAGHDLDVLDQQAWDGINIDSQRRSLRADMTATIDQS
ncbi:hypothetical protein HMPREF0185_00969 [Brevundimonas diminuta 470-4]|nr:hypothetical protein HMPREF0185_00969 [Brevundimonas diminuta 470-4]